MIKTIITFVFVMTVNLLFAQDDIAKATWVSSPVKVDGNAQEWRQPFSLYDNSTKLFFAFANDSKFLYLCFQTNDAANETKIMRAGMKITLTTKNKHKASISFPMAHKNETVKPDNENSLDQKFNKANKRYSFLVDNTTMEVKGFDIKDGVIPINDSSGLNAAINWDSTGKFCYEIAIPLNELFGKGYLVEDISKEISLHVEVNAIKREYRSPGGNGSNSFSGGRGGGRGSHGMNGGGGNYGNRSSGNEENNLELIGSDRAAMFEKGDMKEKFLLAPKQ